MNTSPAFSLLITTRDRKEDVLRTLAVMAPVLLPDGEIVVFDDGSKDGTAAEVSRQFPGVTLVACSPSVGYIAARNRLLNSARTAYAISLDDDAEVVTPDALARVATHFERNPRCGVVALSVYWGLSPPDSSPSPDTPPYRVRSFVGCGHVWRLEAWRVVAPYPEWFEFYGEESYASLQLLRSGWEVHYLPGVLVHHRVDLKHRPSERQAARYRWHFRSGLYLTCLFYPLGTLPRRITYAFAAQVRRRLFRERRWRAVVDLAWVAKDLIFNLGNVLRWRAGLTRSQWLTWNTTPEPVIYWQPRRVDFEPS